MPNFIITDSITSAQTLNSSETGIVAAGASLTTLGTAVTVEAQAATAELTIMGSLIAGGASADGVNFSGGADSVMVNVGSTGSIMSGQSNAIVGSIGGIFSLTNAGFISGLSGLQLFGSSGNQSANLINSGTILSAGLGAIRTSASLETISFVNTGTVIGQSYAARPLIEFGSAGTHRIANSGQIVAVENPTGTIGFDLFALGSGGRLRLDNTGTITGNVAFVLSVVLDNDGLISGMISDTGNAAESEASSIQNRGTISGPVILAAGDDIVVNSGTLGDGINLGAGTNVLTNADGRIIGSVFGGASGDLVANSGLIQGDVTLGSGGNSFTNAGGQVTGTVAGGAGNDVFRNSGVIEGDVVLGNGSNSFNNRGGTVLGVVFGGNGTDTYVIDSSDVVIEDAGGSSDTVRSFVDYRLVAGIERLIAMAQTGLELRGRGGNEHIEGAAGDDTLVGHGGNDWLVDGGGDDLLIGGTGDDTMFGGSGSNSLSGGTGDDFLVWSGGEDSLDGEAGTDTLALNVTGVNYVINLQAGTLVATDAVSGIVTGSATLLSIENLLATDGPVNAIGTSGGNLMNGGQGSDHLNGGNGNDTLQANEGNDTLLGGGGGDQLTGGTGDDVLDGEAGADTLFGGVGRDTMTGGSGTDRFVFGLSGESAPGTPDLITDFAVGSELIDLTAIDANPATGGDDAFVFVGTNAFSGGGAQVRFVQDAGAGITLVQIRLTRSGTTDMEIALTGLLDLTEANFLL